jgi:hypothetical protein
MCNDNVIENLNGEIWKCGGFYMVYLKNSRLSAKIAAWKESILTAEYPYPSKQFQIPGKKLDHAMKLLAFEKAKDQITDTSLEEIFEHGKIQYNLF